MIWAKLRSFFRNVARRSRMERQMSEELQFHLEQRAEDLVRRRGLSPEEAMRTARLEFGPVEKYKEEARQNLGLRIVDELRADVRYAFRTFARNKGFTVAAIATLALGIGANTAVFSVADALLFRPLPVRNPEELVAFDWLRSPDSMVASYSGYGRPFRLSPGPGSELGIRTSFSALTVERFRDHNSTLSHLFAFSAARRPNVIIDGQAETASVLMVTGEYFDGLGVGAATGRVISPSDDRPVPQPVAVITHRYWQRRFAGDPNILGRVIQVNGLGLSIIGVTPKGFDGPLMSESFDLTVPIGLASSLNQPQGAPPVSVWWMQMMGRLRPGVTREQALADLQSGFVDTVRESWAARSPDTPNPTRSGIPTLRVQAGAQGPDGPRIDAMQVIGAVFPIVGAVLLIGCANLATLLLVRASARRQEVLVRLTLGASRWRVIRQLLSESLLLAVAGGIGGSILAVWGKNFMTWLPSGDVPIVDARLDLRVLGFAAALCAITAVAFGIGPSLRATRTVPGPALKSSAQKGGVRRGILSKALLSAQVAVSLVLLVGAGLFARTLYNFSQVDVGFNADNLLLFHINPAREDDSPARIFDLYDRLMSTLEAVPGVESCTLSAMPLLARRQWQESVQADNTRIPTNAFINVVRWNFLETMGIPLLAGRDLSAGDIQGRPRVAVINLTMARELFADPNPVGRHFQFVDGVDRNVPIEVVGVAGDCKYSTLDQRIPPSLFLPHTQMRSRDMTVEVRTSADPTSLVPAIRQAVRKIDATLALADMKTQRQQISETTGGPRAFALLAAVAATIALLLACIGLYGVVSYDATRRTNEIGIRMALGARRSHVLALVMRQTIVVITVGALLGIGFALAASQLISSLLFGIEPTDPIAFAAAVALLVSVAALAAYLPARRASRLDPTRALRYE